MLHKAILLWLQTEEECTDTDRLGTEQISKDWGGQVMDDYLSAIDV
jgi:hypothetical protein